MALGSHIKHFNYNPDGTPIEEDAVEESFEGHKGRPGKRGGSQPKNKAASKKPKNSREAIQKSRTGPVLPTEDVEVKSEVTGLQTRLKPRTKRSAEEKVTTSTIKKVTPEERVAQVERRMAQRKLDRGKDTGYSYGGTERSDEGTTERVGNQPEALRSRQDRGGAKYNPDKKVRGRLTQEEVDQATKLVAHAEKMQAKFGRDMTPEEKKAVKTLKLHQQVLDAQKIVDDYVKAGGVPDEGAEGPRAASNPEIRLAMDFLKANAPLDPAKIQANRERVTKRGEKAIRPKKKDALEAANMDWLGDVEKGDFKSAVEKISKANSVEAIRSRAKEEEQVEGGKTLPVPDFGDGLLRTYDGQRVSPGHFPIHHKDTRPGEQVYVQVNQRELRGPFTVEKGPAPGTDMYKFYSNMGLDDQSGLYNKKSGEFIPFFGQAMLPAPSQILMDSKKALRKRGTELPISGNVTVRHRTKEEFGESNSEYTVAIKTPEIEGSEAVHKTEEIHFDKPEPALAHAHKTAYQHTDMLYDKVPSQVVINPAEYYNMVIQNKMRLTRKDKAKIIRKADVPPPSRKLSAEEKKANLESELGRRRG